MKIIDLELKIQTKRFLPIVILVVYIILSNSVFFLCNEQTIKALAEEDKFFETLGAIFFLLASLLFFFLFIKSKTGNDFYLFSLKKNIFFLMLAILFFVAAGEEVSWGQRFFGYTPPSVVGDTNLANEFNIHNLKFFDVRLKSGWAKWLSIERLFLLFSLCYTLFIPVLVILNKKIASLVTKFNIPLVPLEYGIFCFVNMAGTKILGQKLKTMFAEGLFRTMYSAGEIKETTYAFLFFMIAIYFLRIQLLSSKPKLQSSD